MTQFWDRQLDNRRNLARHNQGDAIRRSALARKCPVCGRLGAITRTVDDDGSLRLECRRESCGYQRVVPLTEL